jgi:hypothetical protein
MQSTSCLLRFARVAMATFSIGLAVSSIAINASAQSTPTVVLNDSQILRSSPKRAGVNLGSVNYYDTGQMLKNLIGTLNPGFEPTISQQIWVLTSPGTTTSFTDPDAYDTVPANYWTGGTFTVIASQSGGAELGCTGTIASNTGPNYPNENNTSPSFTMSNACPAAFNTGDMVVFKKTVSPTPESWWENNQNGFWTNVSGGGKLLSDTTDLCSTCGTQALQLSATTAGSSAAINAYYDSSPTVNLFVLMNGTYQLSFWAKAAAGSPSLSVTANRTSAGGFNCGTYMPTLTSTWTQYTYTCKASETQSSTTPGTAQVNFSVTGGAVDLDNVNFSKEGSSSNTTAFRDEVISTLQNYFSISSGGNPGVLRNWLNQNGETLDNWTAPDYAHGPTVGGANYFDGPNGQGSLQLSLEDYLVICQLLHAEPYLEVPVTFTTQDAANLVEFLAAPSSTKYGGRRAALGQSSPWTSVFSKIHLSFCNECWNGGTFPGQSLPWRSNQPANELFYDYSIRAKAIFGAMHADSYYSSSALDLVMNAQTAQNWAMDAEIARVQPDSIELEDYTYGTVNDFSSDADLWGPAMVEPYDKATDPNDPSNFYQSVQDYQAQKSCGASGSATCNVNIYEWGQGTVNGSIDQTHTDYINAGAGEGVIAVLEPMLNLQNFGIVNDAYFALAEFNNGGLNGRTVKLWGNTVDMGGATNNMRPQFLALSLMNQSIIGPMYSCPISNNATYNFAGNSSNGTNPPSAGMPALKNVPYLYSFCFQNGTKRSLVLVNTDLTSSHTLAFSGTNPPSGAVTERVYASSGLDNMNEAPTGEPTNTTKATVALASTTLANPTSVTLPPHSVIALDYIGGSGTQVSQTPTPAISPAAGTYSSSVSVTLTDSVPGATIYYTTDGSTPTTSSAVYNGAIAVSSSKTVKAIAAATGYTNSATASAAYTISTVSGTVATPTFSPAGGSYTAAQKVTISDATSGAKIYYTADGSTPSTSSTAYTGPITVSTSATVKAIAVASGKTNSTVASASYTISSASSVPNFPNGLASSKLSLNGSAKLSGNQLVLTNNGFSQAASAWFGQKVAVNKFTTDFDFQLLSPQADGITFTIQNSGLTAVGSNGGGLGYAGISKSVAVKFDLYNNSGEGSDSTGVYLNGAHPGLPATNLAPSGLNLHSGDTFWAHLVYNGTTLTITLEDKKTQKLFTKSFTVNIPQAVGATTAYVGFTGATGGATSTQEILTWTYSQQ